MALSPVSRLSLPGDVIERLSAEITGQVLVTGDDGYDTARTVWNGMIDRSPTVIVQPTTTQDVVAAVRFAAAEQLPIAIRGGGHNAAGLAVCDDGLMIDLSRMRSVEVDPAQKTARAQGGATWADFDAATQAHGLATTGGAISMTGIAGLTLGGGVGNLMRSYGLSLDNLISAEVVTASGEVVTASATENPDLFWGLRGGGGNFGVVTMLEYRLHEVGEVLGGMLLFPVDRAPALLRLHRQVTQSAPDELTTFAGMLHAPDGTQVCAIVPAYNGPASEGTVVIQPYRDFDTPIVDSVGPMAYTAMQQQLDEGFPAGQHNYWRSHFLTGIPDEAIDTVVGHFLRSPSPMNAVLFEQLGGAVARVGRVETAFNHRDAAFNLLMIARWVDPDQAEANIAWVRGLSEALGPFAEGVYVNYLGVGEQADRVRAAYGEEKYARLVELKNRYDPQNRFCFNQNITPTI